MVFLYVLIGVLVLIALLHFTAKSQYVVKRDINVQKPADKIFEYLKYLKNQDQWSPWNRKDPDMNKSYEGVDGTVGFISKWEGNKEVGSGEQEITGIIPGKRIESQLRF
ncbi:MAG TPA: polyketide cyclase, partial [Leeuwenhoekiella sp.]|nr:polyketide cyclase [Leeuwenhoekiella sp.]